MWTTENRRRYDRDELRYPRDLTDDEWAQVEYLIPPARRGGRRREVDVRKVLNGRFCCGFATPTRSGRRRGMTQHRQAVQVSRDQSFKGRQFTADVFYRV